MRRAISITMMVLFLLTAVTGLVAWRANAADSDVHTVFAILFILAMVIHIVINRKSVLKKAVYIMYLALLPLTLVSAIAEENVHPSEAGTHVIISLLFVVLMIAHIKANWKALARHLGIQRKATQKTME